MQPENVEMILWLHESKITAGSEPVADYEVADFKLDATLAEAGLGNNCYLRLQASAVVKMILRGLIQL
jgi:hypothetical protein